MKTLIWFRDDLRIQDQPALQRAMNRGTSGVAALFIATPSSWKRHGIGRPRISFTLSTLKSLQQELKELRIPLIYREVPSHSDVAELMEELVHTHRFDEVHAGIEYGVDERRARGVLTVSNHLRGRERDDSDALLALSDDLLSYWKMHSAKWATPLRM